MPGACFVTSGSGGPGRALIGRLCRQQGRALDMLVGIYAAEIAHTAVRVNLFNPGPIAPPCANEAFPGENREAQRHRRRMLRH